MNELAWSLIILNVLKVVATVVVLDPHPDITIERETFHDAFHGIYQDIVHYVPNAILESASIAITESQ